MHTSGQPMAKRSMNYAAMSTWIKDWIHNSRVLTCADLVTRKPRQPLIKERGRLVAASAHVHHSYLSLYARKKVLLKLSKVSTNSLLVSVCLLIQT
jgi:hypothetical protein